MQHRHDIEELIRESRFRTSPAADRRILADAEAEMTEKLHGSGPGRFIARPWAVIMRNRWAHVGFAAAVLAAIGLTVFLAVRATTPAYAFEDTVEAARKVTSVHVRDLSPPAQGPQEMWLEFDRDGKIVRARVEEGAGESFRIATWVNEKLTFWRPSKKEFLVLPLGQDTWRELRRDVGRVDPKAAVESAFNMAAGGKADLTIRYPDQKDDPVEATVTPDGSKLRYVLLIDSKTKLATQRDTLFLRDGRYELQSRQRYLEYNVPLAEELFVLEPPEGVKVDDRTRDVGVPQGDLSDAEAAVKVLRSHLQGLIARDYKTAVRPRGARKMPEELRQRIEGRLKIKHVRIVPIGEPVEHAQRARSSTPYRSPWRSRRTVRSGSQARRRCPSMFDLPCQDALNVRHRCPRSPTHGDPWTA